MAIAWTGFGRSCGRHPLVTLLVSYLPLLPNYNLLLQVVK
jgi:hypothetical protein